MLSFRKTGVCAGPARSLLLTLDFLSHRPSCQRVDSATQPCCIRCHVNGLYTLSQTLVHTCLLSETRAHTLSAGDTATGRGRDAVCTQHLVTVVILTVSTLGYGLHATLQCWGLHSCPPHLWGTLEFPSDPRLPPHVPSSFLQSRIDHPPDR